MDDRQHREALVGQPLDDVGQPQRLAPVQRPGDEAADERRELIVAPGRRDRRMTDVEVDVEVGVRDPVRMVQAQRDLRQPPAQRLEKVQPLLELPAPRLVRLVPRGVGT